MFAESMEYMTQSKKKTLFFVNLWNSCLPAYYCFKAFYSFFLAQLGKIGTVGEYRE
jgi:hypothetical protein